MQIFKIIFFCFFFFNCFCVDIGSDTSVTRFNVQQTLQDGDRIAGFAGLNAGFELFDSNVTALFDCFFPVSGVIQLNGGILNLNQDLVFQEAGSFASIGTINANQHAVHLSPDMNVIPSGDIINCNLTFVTDVTVGTQNVIVNDWSYNDRYIAFGLTSGTNDELQLYEFDGTTLTFRDSFNATGARVATLSWHPTELLLAVGKQPSAAEDELLIFSFDGTSLTLVDSVNFAVEVAGVKFHPTGDYLAVTTSIDTEEVSVYPISSTGILDEPNRVIADISPDNPDIDSLDWDKDGTYLAVGTATAGPSSPVTYVFEFTFPTLTLTQNASIAAGSRVRDVAWNPSTTNYLAIATHATPEVVLYEHNADAGTLTSISTISVGGPNGIGCAWKKDGECFALSTANNGAAGEFQIYWFNPNLLTFTLIEDFEIGVNTREPTYSHDGRYVGVGNNSPGALSIYASEMFNTPFIFSNIRFFMYNNLTLKDCAISFTGNNILNGQGNCLTFMPTCTLFIAEGASLLIQDIRIEGFGDSKITMQDSTSTVSFKDVVLIHDTDYSFTQGRFDVIRGLTLEGEGKIFNYQSDQVSSIISTGIMTVGPNFTLNYDPVIVLQNLIQLKAETSKIVLNNAVLSTSDVGMQLTKGTLIVEGKSQLSNLGSSISQAIIFGDGIDSVNNLCIEWEPAARLDVINGFFRNANI